MSRIRTAFFGTPDFARTCLEGLIKDAHFEVVGVVTQPDRPAGRHLKLQPSPVKDLVQPLGIPVLCPENVNEPAVLEAISQWKAEVAVVVAFGQILKQGILDLFPRKIVNVHASLLPRWRGAAPIQRAIMAGDNETGVCLQVLVLKLDAGDVLGTRKLNLDEGLDAMDVHEKMKPLAVELLSVDLMDYLRGNLSPIPQDESRVTYASKIDKAECRIDWSRKAVELSNQIRGLAMGPSAACRREGQILKVLKAKVAPGMKGQPGAVVGVDENSFTVACGSDGLQVFLVQPESRARMAVKEYLKGYPLAVGQMLE